MNLSSLFQRSVQQYGDRPALACGTSAAFSYSALDRRVRSLAYWLRHGLGLNVGDRILLAMKNCPEYAELMLASWHAGLCVVPVNAKLHINEIEYMLRDSGAGACMSQGTLYQSLRSLADNDVELKVIDVAADDYRAALSGPLLDPMSVAANDLAWLFYTSGTTGRPKGVMLTHANMVSMAMHFLIDVQSLASDDVLIHVAPMSHGSGLYGIPYFIKGALQVIPESGGLDEAELFGLLNSYDKVSLFAAPTIVTRLIQHAKQHRVAWPGLRCLLVGGAPFYAEDIKSAIHCFGPHVAQLYGQGETPMTISALPAALLADAVAKNDTAMLASVGFAQTAIGITIVDAEDHPVPQGMPGEVIVRGPTVMAGYWGNPEATDKTIGNGALRTGDIGLIDERGLLHLKDRSKDVIISGGTNIYPREVEEALLTHPAVEEVSVVGAPDREWGESVVAFIVCHAGKTVNEQELDEVCIRTIARFKRPKRYVFVDKLPKNGTGKVLKRELQQKLKSTA
ncbi:AMP-binding protein [Herbaspirillum sp. RV1423]|uniref:AMP-binding protein n=1 Tax=Herbaspirillum sp. RV1423 TaxID=1443993 RepID=UPI0004B130FA|nr:AMP-binding protein [Herbaspirillum sp. RV1423]